MRHIVEFRTPQHPSLGKNNWGGASPLLARNIPHETIELRYLKLNSTRTRDEIFPLLEDDDYLPVSYTPRLQCLESKSKEVKGVRFCRSCLYHGKGRGRHCQAQIQGRNGSRNGIIKIDGLKAGAKVYFDCLIVYMSK